MSSFLKPGRFHERLTARALQPLHSLAQPGFPLHGTKSSHHCYIQTSKIEGGKIEAIQTPHRITVKIKPLILTNNCNSS